MLQRLAREQEEIRISVLIKLGQGHCGNGCCMEIVEAENLDLVAGALYSMSGNFWSVEGRKLLFCTCHTRSKPEQVQHGDGRGRKPRSAC